MYDKKNCNILQICLKSVFVTFNVEEVKWKQITYYEQYSVWMTGILNNESKIKNVAMAPSWKKIDTKHNLHKLLYSKNCKLLVYYNSTHFETLSCSGDVSKSMKYDLISMWPYMISYQRLKSFVKCCINTFMYRREMKDRHQNLHKNLMKNKCFSPRTLLKVNCIKII